jgi:hypothetical protein
LEPSPLSEINATGSGFQSFTVKAVTRTAHAVSSKREPHFVVYWTL